MEKRERHDGRAALALAVAMALWPGGAPAGPLSGALEPSLRNQDGGWVPVIITFSGRVDPALFRHADRRQRQAALIEALRTRAAQRQATALALLKARGAREVKPLWVNNSIAATVPPGLLAELETVPGIESIRPDALVAAPEAGAVATVSGEWNILAVHAADLWALGLDGSGMVVANMDTGVDASHPDLQARWRGNGNSWYDPNQEHATPYDTSGHGTRTMGLMVGGAAGGTTVGVAPGAKWIAVKIFNDAGYATLSGIHQGFQWLLDPDGDPATLDAPHVVNNSWGLQNSGQCDPEFNTDIEVLKAAGIGVVFAAGNSGPAAYTGESPANTGAALAVGAVDGGAAIADFSSRGPSACDGGLFPQLAAPGVTVKSTDLSFGGMPLYATVSGSSFAAPHVAGGYALLAQAFPSAGVAVLEEALKSGARDLGAPGPDSDYGYGALDLLAAYRLVEANPPAPANRAPVAVNDGYSVTAGATLAVNAPGVLGNDSDPDGDPVSAALLSGPTDGTLVFRPDGAFSYTPLAGVTRDSFSYQASDGAQTSAVATVAITVVPNQPPVAAGDKAQTRRNTPVTVDVVANDADPDGRLDRGSVTLVTKPAKGTVVVGGDGRVVYTPKGGFTGTDSFGYTVRDDLGALSNKAVVSIAVTR